VSPQELGEILLSLQEQGAHNINFVTPTHFTDGILETLALVRDRLKIPVVWNTSVYERVETLRRLEGVVDIYMPDLKYGTEELGKRYSMAPDYAEAALAAIEEMARQAGRPVFDGEGMLLRGVLVRHLVLPSHREDSISVLRALAERVGTQSVLLSLMSQYTPDFAMDTPYGNLHRRLTTFEYQSVMREAERLGFEGFMQGRSSAKTDFTPDFE
jgi:putative pyruvate formate lyase activating enzyme